MKDKEELLFIAINEAKWSTSADEYFKYTRVYLNGTWTNRVEVRWRHGPGICNSRIPEVVE